MDGQTRVNVEIYNDQYTIRGDARPEYIRKLALRVDERIRALAAQHPRVSAGRLAVLAALNLADELQRLSDQHERVVGMLEREWERRGAVPGRNDGTRQTSLLDPVSRAGGTDGSRPPSPDGSSRPAGA